MMEYCSECGATTDSWHFSTCSKDTPANIPSNPKKDLTMTKNHATVSALDTQVAGSHYKGLKIQPVEYIHANKLGYFEGNVVKYVTRWKTKGGIADLEKARHYIDLLIELDRKEIIAGKEK